MIVIRGDDVKERGEMEKRFDVCLHYTLVFSLNLFLYLFKKVKI